MARKSFGYTELIWVCPNCNNRNPGLKKVCGTCGSPQPKDVKFQSPEKQDLIQDQKITEQIKAGPDIYCPYCGTRNVANADRCTQCAGDLKDGIRRNVGQIVGAYQSKETAKINCPHCQSPNNETNKYCMKCGGSLPVKPQQVTTVASPPSSFKFSPIVLVAALLGVVLCVVLGIVLLCGSGGGDYLVGTVNSVSWSRSIEILAIAPVTLQDWRDSIPLDAQVQSCEERLHHTQDEPTLGGIEVCGTPYVIDTGTGAGEVVQDCVYEVYQEYCEFTTLDWTIVESPTASGSDNAPYWPETRLGSDQQYGNQSAIYQVIFLADGDQYSFSTSDLDLFQSLIPGSQWELQTDIFNKIIDISPVD